MKEIRDHSGRTLVWHNKNYCKVCPFQTIQKNLFCFKYTHKGFWLRNWAAESGWCFLTWAERTRFSPRGESGVCLWCPTGDWVDFERVWHASTSRLTELCFSALSTLVLKLWCCFNSSLLSSSRADCLHVLLCKVSWSRAAVLTLQRENIDARLY